MRRITNPRLIKRNQWIGRGSSLLGLAVLLGGLLFSFRNPEQAVVPFATLLLGFLLSNVGIYFANRWVRPPRPDEALDGALKGLDDRYSLYHYRLGGSHVLIGPAGVIAIATKFQNGAVWHERGRWRHRGGNVLLKFFGQESLGNPAFEAAAEVNATARALAKQLPGNSIPAVRPILVFTHPNAEVHAEGAPIPTMHVKQLKGYVRSLPKNPTLTKEQIIEVETKLGLREESDA